MSERTYTCHRCATDGCKLWRQYQSFDLALYCAPCAGKDQGKDVTSIDDKGQRLSRHGGRTDQIGWLVPAVPVDIEDLSQGFWGYTSVPENLCEWWRGLPTLPKATP